MCITQYLRLLQNWQYEWNLLLLNMQRWKQSVVLIFSPLPWHITVSIKHQNHSQETPTISWHVYHFNNCLPNGDIIFLVYRTSFFINLFWICPEQVRCFDLTNIDIVFSRVAFYPLEHVFSYVLRKTKKYSALVICIEPATRALIFACAACVSGFRFHQWNIKEHSVPVLQKVFLNPLYACLAHL